MSFDQFLVGLHMFVKAPRAKRVASVFRLCDYEDRGYLTEDEFTAMMLNYPYQDLERMLPRDFVYRGKFSQDIFQSTILSNGVEGTTFHQGIGNYPEMTIRHPSLATMKPDSEMLEKLKALHKNNKMVQRKHMPTSVNNKIKAWAVMQFKAFSKEGAMQLDDFQSWANENNAFFNRFREFFCASLWMEYSDISMQKTRLGFCRLTPERQTVANYGLTKELLQRCRICMYSAFVLIFSEETREMPIRIIVFKELESEFFDRELIIDFSHKSPIYQAFRIQFNNIEGYNEWKKLTKQYSLVSFRNKYRIKSKLGTGKFSVVSLAENIETGKSYAVKVIDKSKLTIEEAHILKNEVSIMKVLDSPYIIKFYEDIENLENYYYVMEVGAGKDLMTYTTTQPGGVLPESVIAQIMQALLEALEYIHKAGIVHRDLKPENILIDISEDSVLKSLKIIDFGFAVYMQDIKKTLCPVGTLNYMAPESFTKIYDYRVDIFALGVILYFLSSGLLPFFSEEPEIVIRNTRECIIDLESEECFLGRSKNLKNIIEQLLQRCPNARISIADALQHPFLLEHKRLKRTGTRIEPL